MDIRIITLLVVISIAGSFAESQSLLVRQRRNGITGEGERQHLGEYVVVARTRREAGKANDKSDNSNKTESVAPENASTTASHNSESEPTTTTAPKTITPKTNPVTRSASDSDPTTSSPPAKSDPTTTSSPTSVTENTRASTTSPPTTTKSPTQSKKPTDSGKDSNPESASAATDIGSRSNFDQSEGKEPKSKSNPNAKHGPSYGNPMPFYPGFPSFDQQPYPGFGPNFAPGYSSPYNPYRGDPTFNSIPGPGNYAWTGTHNGPGSASAVASAGASTGSFAGPSNPGMLASRGGFEENAPTSSGYGANRAAGPSPYAQNSFGFSGFDPDPFNIQKQLEEQFRQLQAQFEANQRMIFEASNRIGSEGYPGSSSSGPQAAFSSINLGPGGGYQAGGISPAAPGFESRFGEDLPAPSGNSYGVYSSSSSSTKTGPDGKQISRKSSTTAVNDNGKITFRTVHD